jgi:hypothetical protein
MRASFLATGAVAVVIAGAAYAATSKLMIPHLREALIREGYPARTQCGEVAETPPARTAKGGVVRMTSVPACWVIIERNGYSVSIIPHSSPAAAKVAYRSLHNVRSDAGAAGARTTLCRQRVTDRRLGERAYA